MTLSERLDAAGRAYDDYLAAPHNIHVAPAYGQVKRDPANPSYVAMPPAREARAKAEKWYIDPDELRALGPAQFVTLDKRPVLENINGYKNPYGPTGLKGPGVLGVGYDDQGRPIPENRAVDVVLQFISPIDGRIKFIGGTRTDTHQPCFIGGFVGEDVIKAAAREFIEEAISGSLKLEEIAPRLAAAHKRAHAGEPLKQGDWDAMQSYGIQPKHILGDAGEIIGRVIAHDDPAFVKAIIDYFGQNLKIAYEGPCRADPRTTDDRWLATTLYTGLIDLGAVEKLLQGRVFPYRLAAGSDLEKLSFHDFGPAFVKNAFGDHGAFACIATAHNLEKLRDITPTMTRQCEDVIASLPIPARGIGPRRDLDTRPALV